MSDHTRQASAPTPRELFLAVRQSYPRAPRLTRHTVRARGLDFAVFTSPAVPGAVPLACVNGGLLYDHKVLWPSLAPLAAHRQLVLYDQRGRGASQAPPGARAARIEHDAGDLPALREAMGIERWDVLGHSWGGGIAMLATAQDEDAVRRLVLVDAVGVAGDWLPTLHDAALARLTGDVRDALARHDPAALVEPVPAVHAAYARAYYPAWYADQTMPALFPAPRSASVTGAAVTARLRRDGYDWRARLRALGVPTLVIHGEDDVLPVAQAERTTELLSNARLVTLARSGHMPFWEAPDRFFPLVEQFLA
jgi:proline iminopeptidase